MTKRPLIESRGQAIIIESLLQTAATFAVTKEDVAAFLRGGKIDDYKKGPVENLIQTAGNMAVTREDLEAYFMNKE